jgi:TetR/AcrR family transcriptional repressor of nem operon
MKKSRAETAQTRQRILEVAVQAFKSKGITATGVAEIMAGAGLSHGGFYRHFETKEQLVAKACAASMATFVQSFEAAAAGGHESFLKHLQDFLSTAHRDEMLGGCALVAIGSELVRADAETRRAATQGFEDLVDVIAKWMPQKDSSSAKDEALFTLSAMIGAVTMARMIDDPALSARTLDVARERLAPQPSRPQKKRARSTRG